MRFVGSIPRGNRVKHSRGCRWENFKMKTRLAENSNIKSNIVHGRSMRPSVKSGHGMKVEKSVTISRPAEEIYSFWRQLQNLPLFMRHIESVSQIGQGASHWVVKTSHGRTLEWDAQIIE